MQYRATAVRYNAVLKIQFIYIIPQAPCVYDTVFIRECHSRDGSIFPAFSSYPFNNETVKLPEEYTCTVYCYQREKSFIVTSGGRTILSPSLRFPCVSVPRSRFRDLLSFLTPNNCYVAKMIPTMIWTGTLRKFSPRFFTVSLIHENTIFRFIGARRTEEGISQVACPDSHFSSPKHRPECQRP